ncbi:helix-turn-helix domain-containing protein [Cupriavidus sp. D384]
MSSGTPVNQVALDLGYDSPSAFSTMSRKALGAPPSSFLHAAR